jgi:DNA-binding PadR family transcriptional regulator
VRLSPQTIQVLEIFLEDPKSWNYGYDISRSTGLKSGTLYPILMRLEERKLLETCWESAEVGKPPRHMYRLTPDGLKYACERLSTRRGLRAQRPVFEGGGS